MEVIEGDPQLDGNKGDFSSASKKRRMLLLFRQQRGDSGDSNYNCMYAAVVALLMIFLITLAGYIHASAESGLDGNELTSSRSTHSASHSLEKNVDIVPLNDGLLGHPILVQAICGQTC